jgi:hypothetical protein
MPKKLSLTLSENASEVSSAFKEWHRILKADAYEIGSALQIAGTDIRFRRITRHEDKLHLDFWIASSDFAAVQLNQPGSAGSENPGSTIAVDKKGRRYLVRQGDLHGNPPSARIRGDEFAHRTGLVPVDMEVGQTKARKSWYVVARLDDRSARTIRRDTVDFVRRCWNARTYGKTAGEDQDRLDVLFGKAERGGWFDVDQTQTSKRVVRVQGYVSEYLMQILRESDITLRKPRHAANYEVDGTIEAATGAILLEIKTGISAADVYCGVGQLTVYPIILPDLAGYAKILLLPGTPQAPLVDALKGSGVELHSYALKRGRKRADAVFSAAFLRRCGVPERKVTQLVANGRAFR